MMNTMRRMLLTFFVVALLVGTLLMPSAAFAARPTMARTVWVTPGVETSLNVGEVLLRIPADAVTAPFLLTVSVEYVDGGVIVDLDPDVTFDLRVLLSFGPRVSTAFDGSDELGEPLEPAEPEYWRGNQPAFWLEHFSRYSGWF